MRCKWISLLVSVVLVASVAMLVAPKAAAQNTGDYRSKQTGNWGEAATWERYEGTAWVDATTAPTYTDGVITIRNGHTVTIVADVTVDQVVIEAGGQVTVNSGFTFSTNNGTGDELTIYGTFLHSGTVASTMNGTGVLASGGTYIHNTISSAKRMVDFFNAGSVAADSTFIYRGSLTLRPAMSMSGQTYGNLTFESTSGSWSTEALVGGTATTIKGNFTLGSGVTFNNNTLVGLNVAGNWTNNGTFTAGSGTVTFNGGTTQNLTLNTATTFNNLTVGSGTILVETVSTDNATVSALTNNGTIRKAKSVSGDSNTFGLAGGPINGANLNINVTAGSFTSIQVDRTDSNHANRTGTGENSGVGWGRYWTITPTGSGTVNLTLPANFTTGANSKVCRWIDGPGYGWDCAMTSYTSNTVTRNGVSSFSDWAAGNAGPTAITLSSLTAASPLPATLPVLSLIVLGGLAAAAALGIGAGLVRRRRG